VTRGRNTLLEWLLKECKDGTELSKPGTTPYTRNGVGINPLKDGSPNWDNSTEKIYSAYCFPSNDARNACWCSLASPLSNGARERLVVKHTITERSASARIIVVALHLMVFGLSIYIFPAPIHLSRFELGEQLVHCQGVILLRLHNSLELSTPNRTIQRL
jgi:hypothetical protein